MKSLLVSFFVTLVLFYSGSSEACLQFPCGMYSPSHPVNQPKPEPVTTVIAPKSVSCEMAGIKNSKDAGSFEYAIKAEDGIYEYSKASLDYDRYNYTLELGFSEDEAEYIVSALITENNVAQDEIVSFECSFPKNKIKNDVLCRNTFNFEERGQFAVTCKVNY